jgi:tetratricopeptide (TPR) repeat protein
MRPSRAAAAVLLAAALLGPPPAAADFASLVGDPRAIPAGKEPRCPGTDADPDEPELDTPTLPEALAGLDELVRDGAGAEAVRALDSSPEARDPGLAAQAAAGAMVLRRPLAALGLLLRAHRAAPSDPSPLVNLAGLANMLGRHGEALALASAAEATGREPAAPPGLSGRAVLLNDKGDALLGLGRTREAKAALEAATALQPDLSEAWVNLAHAQGDLGDCPKAIQALRRGSSRRAPPGEGPPGAGDEARLRRLVEPVLVDLSRGREAALPLVPLPRTPEEAAGLRERMQARVSALQAEARALGPKLEAAGEAASRRRAAWKRSGLSGGLTARRAAALVSAVQDYGREDPVARGLGGDPEVARLARSWKEAQEALRAASRKAEREASKRMEQVPSTDEAAQRRFFCDVARSFGDAVRPAAHALDRAARPLFHATYLRASAAASTFADPAHREWAKARLDLHRTGAFQGLLVELDGSYVAPLASLGQACGRAPGPALGTSPDPGLDFCELVPGGKDVKATVSAGVVQLGVSCEEVSVGVKTPGVVGAFHEVSLDMGSGHLTIFSGGYAGGDVAGVGAEGKAGGYVTFDSRGNVVDVGVKADASISAAGVERNLGGSRVSFVSGRAGS